MADIQAIIDVVSVRVLGRYVVELLFEDGETRVLDLESMLTGPMYEPLLRDYDLFTAVEVDPSSGTISWPNGADISPRRLYAESKSKVPA